MKGPRRVVPRMLAPSRIMRTTPAQAGGGREREDLIDYAEDAIGKGSKSFALASRLLDRGTRERVWLLYAWCRRCDDLADAQDLGGALGEQEGAERRVTAIRLLTERALNGLPTADPAFDAHLPDPANRAPEGPPGAVINPAFRGLVHDHAALVRDAMATPPGDTEFPLIVVARDTTPLSPDAPTVWHGASPGALQARLEAAACDLAGRAPDLRLIFLHAWNDWDTGAVLAPDLRFGHGWLEAIANAADADLLES